MSERDGLLDQLKHVQQSQDALMYDNKLLQHTFHEQEKKMEALLRVSHDSQRAMHEMAQYRVAEHKIIEEALHILLKNNDKVPPAAVDSDEIRG